MSQRWVKESWPTETHARPTKHTSPVYRLSQHELRMKYEFSYLLMVRAAKNNELTFLYFSTVSVFF